ncbi:MAG: hypothetical protein KAT35_03000 [Candidatus Aenigmarchaeota archaeon]|nr:hypothetical protein [Candidatus Aenigmarchaeota archaeon]
MNRIDDAFIIMVLLGIAVLILASFPLNVIMFAVALIIALFGKRKEASCGRT